MLENKSVKEIISLIKKKDVSVKEIVGLYFERIKKFNPSLNAIVSIKDEEEIIKEAEINPIIVKKEKEGIVAVDGLITLN